MALQDYKYEHFLVDSPAPFVAHVQINRPKKLNAFHRAVWLEFRQVFDRLSADPEIRAVVLSGAGDRAFTAGLDVQAAGGDFANASSPDASRNATALRRNIEEFQDSVSAAEKCAKPVICVLHGVSIGLAIDLATACDVRICAEGTRFAVKEVDIGLAADVGTLARLPRVVGSLSWVKDVCYSARDFDAGEALSVGFVSQVHKTKADAVAAGIKMAAFWGEKSPVALQGTKELINHSKNHTVAENLRYTTIWNSVMLQSSDFQTALMSGLSKKKPRFEKL
ncbi:delta-delta-dienoyl-CoA isomerase [Plectosphaerella cucumerina]|uniref:Delta-delta-dienoyl-CoA isomerase n=1 Tax=Plectosphaerella cucumerina TaxID=40658 RepID=A0A8K0TAC5_9PEZI|nr:delta-delta-dienoyl-CoA isomerase [Plectosphaerella cucumerina]